MQTLLDVQPHTNIPRAQLVKRKLQITGCLVHLWYSNIIQPNLVRSCNRSLHLRVLCFTPFNLWFNILHKVIYQHRPCSCKEGSTCKLATWEEWCVWLSVCLSVCLHVLVSARVGCYFVYMYVCAMNLLECVCVRNSSMYVPICLHISLSCEFNLPSSS